MSSRRTAARPWSTSSASSAGRWDRETRSVPSPTAATSSSCLLRIRCAGKSKFNNLCRLIAIYLKENEQRVRACKYHLFLLSCQCEQIGIAVIRRALTRTTTNFKDRQVLRRQHLPVPLCTFRGTHVPNHANVRVVDLHSLPRMFGPLHILLMHHDFLNEQPQQFRRQFLDVGVAPGF